MVPGLFTHINHAMKDSFLLYGASGFVGREVARVASREGLRPILAGRDLNAISSLAQDLDLEFRIFELNEANEVEKGIGDLPLVLNCAGPFIHTADPFAEACLKTGAHYLDITGEIPVFEALHARDEEARNAGIMLLPGVGFDVVPTDCLALHLKQRLPEATHLTLAFHVDGPAGLPPGTQKTGIELIPYGERERVEGELRKKQGKPNFLEIDFGNGPVRAMSIAWGDVFTAFHTTGIPNVEDYVVFPKAVQKQIALMRKISPLFSSARIRSLMKRAVKDGPSAEERAQTVTHVWGRAWDESGNAVAARLHGPEAAFTWTIDLALASVRKVLEGTSSPGYNTPAMAFGADFVMEGKGVSREDLES